MLGIAAGLAVFSGREWARWTGIFVASLGALGQLMIAQAYPLWSLMIMGVYLLAVYGLAVYGVRGRVPASRPGAPGTREHRDFAGSVGYARDVSDRDRRAA